ncbi:hypothetical protein QBC43DRAFT_326666 [Cladorrhinum sp. PSN259]|nr:hypothetical protein QBC43DRAFT_326666 [Cladorrhinum sp. PSN259]
MPVPPEGSPPEESIEELCAMRLRFFSEALSSFQASSSKFRVICTAPPVICFRVPGSRKREDHCPSPPIPPREPPKSLVVLDSSFNPPTHAHGIMARSAVFDLPGTPRILLVLSVNNADKAPKPASFEQRLSMMWSFARDVQVLLSVGQRGGEIGVDGISVDIALSTLPYFHAKSQAIAEDDFYQGGLSGEWSGRLRERPRLQNTADQDQEPPTKQVILVGYDTVIRLFDLKYYQTEEGNGIQRALGPLFDRATLRVTMRPDDEWGTISEQKQYVKSLFKPRKMVELGLDKSWESKIELVQDSRGWSKGVSSTYARNAAKEGDQEAMKKMIPRRVVEWIQSERLYRE